MKSNPYPFNDINAIHEMFYSTPVATPIPQITSKDICSLPTTPRPWASMPCAAKEEKGNKPMRYETNAIATVAAAKTDVSTQRDYLTRRLELVRYSKGCEFQKLFNLYVDNTPKTYAQLIEAIKDNKYTLDTERTEKVDKRAKREGYYNSPMEGIIWDGPKADHDGYEQAMNDLEKEMTAAKDTIMILTPEDGLKAVQALEAWVPTGAAN